MIYRKIKSNIVPVLLYLTSAVYSVFRYGAPQNEGLLNWVTSIQNNYSYHSGLNQFIVKNSKNQIKIFSDEKRGGLQQYTNSNNQILLSGIQATDILETPYLIQNRDEVLIAVSLGEGISPTRKILIFDQLGTVKQTFNFNFAPGSSYYYLNFFQ